MSEVVVVYPVGMKGDSVYHFLPKVHQKGKFTRCGMRNPPEPLIKLHELPEDYRLCGMCHYCEYGKHKRSLK